MKQSVHDLKKQMIKWRDFYGGELLAIDKVVTATSMDELEKIMHEHRNFLEAQYNDAVTHIEKAMKEFSFNL